MFQNTNGSFTNIESDQRQIISYDNVYNDSRLKKCQNINSRFQELNNPMVSQRAQFLNNTSRKRRFHMKENFDDFPKKKLFKKINKANANVIEMLPKYQTEDKTISNSKFVNDMKSENSFRECLSTNTKHSTDIQRTHAVRSECVRVSISKSRNHSQKNNSNVSTTIVDERCADETNKKKFKQCLPVFNIENEIDIKVSTDQYSKRNNHRLIVSDNVKNFDAECVSDSKKSNSSKDYRKSSSDSRKYKKMQSEIQELDINFKRIDCDKESKKIVTERKRSSCSSNDKSERRKNSKKSTRHDLSPKKLNQIVDRSDNIKKLHRNSIISDINFEECCHHFTDDYGQTLIITDDCIRLPDWIYL